MGEYGQKEGTEEEEANLVDAVVVAAVAVAAAHPKRLHCWEK
jgi:hypothetical protein